MKLLLSILLMLVGVVGAHAQDSSTILRIKTNGVAWGFGVANVGVEYDMGEHFSVNVPLLYNGINFPSRKVKLRCLIIQPELRYWFDEQRTGWFAAAHLGMGSYNVAFGDYRYQDHDARTPALGGGLSGGWRMPLGKTDKWMIEFSMGCGVYYVRYDKYINGKDGYYVGSGSRAFAGIDQLSAGIVYNFDFAKKGGRR